MFNKDGQDLIRNGKLLNCEVMIQDVHGQTRRVTFKEIVTEIYHLTDEDGSVVTLPYFVELEVGLEEEGEKLYDVHPLELIVKSLKEGQTFFVKGNEGVDVVLSLTGQEKEAKVIWPAQPTTFMEGKLSIYHTRIK